MVKKISLYAGTFLALASIVGILFTLDNYVAKAADVEKLSRRLDLKIMMDVGRDLQNRIWMLKDRYEGRSMPLHIKKQIRCLQEDLNKVNADIQQLRRKDGS